MTSLVDTVARALRMDAMCSHNDMWDTLDEHCRNVWRRAAMVAITAFINYRDGATPMAPTIVRDIHEGAPGPCPVSDRLPATSAMTAPAPNDAELNNPTQKVDPIWR